MPSCDRLLFVFQKLKTIQYENNNVSIPVKIVRKLLWFVGTGNCHVYIITIVTSSTTVQGSVCGLSCQLIVVCKSHHFKEHSLVLLRQLLLKQRKLLFLQIYTLIHFWRQPTLQYTMRQKYITDSR